MISSENPLSTFGIMLQRIQAAENAGLFGLLQGDVGKA
jgi:hypothetical protein